MKAARVIKQKSAEHVRIFCSSIEMMRDEEVRLFKRNDFVTFVQALRALFKVKVYTIYKRKNQKVKLSDTCVSDDFKSDDDASWKKDIIKKKKYFKNFIDQFAEFLISKFSELTKEARLKSERIQRMQIENELLKRERELLLEMLFNREVVLFWDFIEKDSVRSKVTSLMKIRTMLHEAWQILEFQILKALTEIVAEMIRDRIKNDVLKSCYEFYRNSWFLVKKKKKEKYRLINVVLKMNRVIIRNANLFFAIDEFSEEFADCAIVSLVNLFSEYDQLSLTEKCRDMIVFMTSFDLMRMTMIFMKAINSVTQFVRVINKIIADHVLHHALSFVNDIEVKESKITYNDEFIVSEIRRYVMKHIQWLNDVLADIERVDCTIFEKKSQFCCEELRVIEFVCDVERRHSDTTKVIKILNWSSCQDAVDAREFIEICVFYRVFIADFALIAQSIYALLKKNVSFVWKLAQQEAMNTLKIAFINSFAFTFIDYAIDVVILAMNASLEDWEEVLMILRNEKKHSVRYESEIWSDAKKKYDVIKKKCREILKTLKKIRFYFYDVKFILKTNVRVLVDQLNRFDTNLSDAFVTRWLAWIRFFDFEVRHVLDIKHTVADELFKKSSSSNDLKKVAEEKNIDDWVNTQLDCVRVFSVSTAKKESSSILASEYFEKSQKIVVYMFKLRKSSEMSLKEFNKFKKKALRFKLQRNQLFRRNSKNVLMRRVIDDLEERQRILKQLHDESDHRNKKDTYKRIINRYWWDDLYDDAQKYVKICSQCQMRDSIREKEALHSIWMTLLWKKIEMNIVHMSSNKEKHYLIVARDDFFEWAEARVLSEAKAWRMTKFLWEDVICRHDCFEKLIVNDESENKEILDELVKRYRIKKMITSDYHSQVNEMIERDHKSLFDALFKMSDEELESWVNNLHVVLWADRFTVKFITDLISFYLQCDSESMLSIELEISIWRILLWQKIHTIEDLLTMRARQLQRRNENMNEARNLLKRMRKQDKKYFDSKHFTTDKNINKNDLVLFHDTQHENDRSINRKLKYRWRRSFRIKEVIQNKEIYLLQKLDETNLAEIFVENRIKKFHQRQSLEISSSVFSNSIMNDHESIDENDVMKKIFDFQSLMSEEWSLAMIIS